MDSLYDIHLNIDKLIDKRIDVIKAEIASILFNLGKTHIGFWKGKDEQKFFSIDENCFETEYGYKVFSKYKEYYSGKNGIIPFEVDLKWDNIKNFFKQTKINLGLFDINEIVFCDLMYGDALVNSKQSMLHKIFFTGCENVNSGIDKGAPKEQCNNLWISNAFGSLRQERGYNGYVKKVYFDMSRLNFFLKLNDELVKYTNDPNDLLYEDWKQIRRFILKEIKAWYSHLLSDTRFPVNDVTLWDQAYMTASLFKASIAAMLLDEKKSNEYKTPKNIRWSILGIQYDKLSLISKSLKAHFISWYNENINTCDEDLKAIIEEEYALGNEIYRDETGIYFIVPENISNDTDQNLHKDLSMIKKDILNVFQKIFPGEIYPSIFITKPSRGTMSLAYLIEKSKENYLIPSLPDKFGKAINYKGFNGICQICGMRPGTIKKDYDENMTLCDHCSDRKESRMDKWLANKGDETIWTGELQDKNGRIALVTLKFELREWLNGDLLNTLVINDVDYQNYLKNIKALLSNMRDVFRSFISGCDKNLSKFYKFDFNNKDSINSFLSLFENDGIKKPYKDVVSQTINIYKSSSTDENVLRLKELFCNEFFQFIRGNWELINEKNKDNDNLIVFDKNGNFVFDINTKEINLKNDRFKTYYVSSWELLTDIFSFAYIETQIKGILLERSVGDRWEAFIKEVLGDKIDYENNRIKWDKLNDDDIDFISGLLLQFLLRKNPSPARLRRISETTKGFMEEIKSDLGNFIFEDCQSEMEWRSKRIVWHVKNLENDQINREYEYKGLEFIADKCGNVYLITSIEKAIDIICESNAENKDGKRKEKILNTIEKNSIEWLKDTI